MELSFYTWTVIAFALAFLVIVYLDRRNFTRQGVVFLRRTNRGKQFIERLAARYPRFWRFYGNFGVAIFIPTMLITVGLFVHTVYTVLVLPETKGVGLLVPSVTNEPIPFTGGLAVPFWYWLIGIVIIAVVHEFGHGIIARREGIKLKSLGGILFGPILGAFVELDEKRMAKANWKITARIASAGALTNMIFAVIFLILFVVALTTMYTTHGMGFVVDPNGPLNVTNLGNNTGILKSLNGVSVSSYDELGNFLQNTKPGDTVEIIYQDSSFSEHSANITLTNRSDGKPHGYMGIITSGERALFGLIDGSQYRTTKINSTATDFTVKFFVWLTLLNLLVGLFNLLPVKPLDGGVVWESYAKGFFPKKAKLIVKVTNYIIYGMLIMLLLGIIRSIVI